VLFHKQERLKANFFFKIFLWKKKNVGKCYDFWVLIFWGWFWERLALMGSGSGCGDGYLHVRVFGG